MNLISLTTASGTTVAYGRDQADQKATVIVDYAIPSLQVYHSKREGWERILDACVQEELEMHQRLIEEARAELIAVLGGSDPSPSEPPLVLKLDVIRCQLAARACQFFGEESALIDAGEFREEWRVLPTPENASDATVVAKVMTWILAERQQQVERVFRRFTHQAQVHGQRN